MRGNLGQDAVDEEGWNINGRCALQELLECGMQSR